MRLSAALISGTASTFFLAAIAALPLAAGAAAATPGAKFEPGPCVETNEPIPALENARCGTLIVPENRARANGKTIRLPIAIIPAVSAAPAKDPIVYMEGGPGGPGIPSAQTMVDGKINASRDVIVVGQRGSRYADPNLTCPEIDAIAGKLAGVRRLGSEARQLSLGAAKQCYDRLKAEGVDLGAYNTTESAADFADLRVTLGIPEWNVYGVSYGTDLALTYMREHPEGVRSVTIDSVLPPPTASLGIGWTDSGQGLGAIFAACAADAACHARYADLEGTLAKLVNDLEKQPLTGKVIPWVFPDKEPPADLKPVDVLVDGAALASWATGVTELLGPDLPRLLDDLANGKHEKAMGSVAATSFAHAGEFSFGLQYGVVCSEWLPYESARDLSAKGRKAFPKYPESVLAQAPQFPFAADVCREWKVPKAPAAQRAMTTGDIPTLVIAGSYDAITSAESAASAAKPLAKSTLAVFPGFGHFVVPKSPCAQHVMQSFLDDPNEPDTSCIASLKVPAFTIAPN